MLNSTPELRLPVAVAQPMTVPGDVPGNVARMTELVRQAAGQGAKLVLFSESALNGYDHHGVGGATALAVDGPVIAQLAGLAQESGVAIVAGFFERDGGCVYNSAVLLSPDGAMVVQRKHQVTDLEKRSAGVVAGPRQRTIVTYRGFRLAILICADAGIEGIYAELAAAGVDVVLGPTAGLGDLAAAFRQHELSDEKRLKDYLQAAASVCFISPETCLRHKLALVCCNQMGWSEPHRYFHCGHAAVIDRTGEVTALIPGRFVVEHLRPQLAVGFVTRSPR